MNGFSVCTSKLCLSFFAAAFLFFFPVFAQTHWTTPRLLNPAAGLQGNPYMAIGPNNEVAITCTEFPPSSGATPRVAVYVSTDHGATFVRSLVPLPPEAYQTLSPLGLQYDRNGNLFVLWGWSQPEPFYTPELVLSKSTDGGTTFSTFWRDRQPLSWLAENPFFIDADNTIHILWDSTVSYNNFVLLYSKFVHGNPGAMITQVVPRPDMVPERLPSASMMVSGDTVHIAVQTPVIVLGQNARCYYTKSIDRGATFVPPVIMDTSSYRPVIVGTTEGSAALYGLYFIQRDQAVPNLRYLTNSSPPFSASVRLGTKGLGVTYFREWLTARNGKNFLIYDGYDGQAALTCFYEYDNFSNRATDSAFFPFGLYSTFAIDSIGSKYLLVERWGEYRIYITTKDVISNVVELRENRQRYSDSILATSTRAAEAVTVFVHLNKTREGTLRIYDILGRTVTTVRNGSFATGDSEFNVSTQSFSSGIYFVVLKSQKEDPLISKFLIAR